MGGGRHWTPAEDALLRELYPLVQGAVRGQMPWHDRETLELAILNARVTRARVALRKRVRA